MSELSAAKLLEQRGVTRINPPTLTIVVPVFNEQDSIGAFIARVSDVLAGAEPDLEFDILFVNDGSTDATELAILTARAQDPRVKLINLSRNFGKDAALCAGLKSAHGRAVIPMDVDLQDPPEVIPEMLEKWRAGAKIVNARRSLREHDSLTKRLTAGAFYKVFNMLAESEIPQDVGDFRLLDHQVVEVLRTLDERSRFNKAIFSWVGFETEEVTYERPARHKGETAWTYWRLWNFALDGILSASTVPLRVWSYVGFSLAVLSFLYASYIFFYTVLFGGDVPGYASTVILILMFGGLNLFAVGILGEYIGRIYTEVRGRPLYVVRSSLLSSEVDQNG